MFTLDQIKAAHAKVKSGADFPAYVQELISLGLESYESFVADANVIYHGADGYTVASGPRYATRAIAPESNADQFIADLKAHQQGKTDYPTFCADCAKSGIEKWIVDMQRMSCTYYSGEGKEILVEQIPTP
jgi:uncharacterized protein YbcV (DUF1398 family)